MESSSLALHPQFGKLILEKHHPVIGALIVIAFGAVMSLLGIAGFSAFNTPIKGFLAILLGIGLVGYGIYHLLTKVGRNYMFYEHGLVKQCFSQITYFPYAELAAFTCTEAPAGGAIPGIGFTMTFQSSDGKHAQVYCDYFIESGSESIAKVRNLAASINVERAAHIAGPNGDGVR